MKLFSICLHCCNQWVSRWTVGAVLGASATSTSMQAIHQRTMLIGSSQVAQRPPCLLPALRPASPPSTRCARADPKAAAAPQAAGQPPAAHPPPPSAECHSRPAIRQQQAPNGGGSSRPVIADRPAPPAGSRASNRNDSRRGGPAGMAARPRAAAAGGRGPAEIRAPAVRDPHHGGSRGRSGPGRSRAYVGRVRLGRRAPRPAHGPPLYPGGPCSGAAALLVASFRE